MQKTSKLKAMLLLFVVAIMSFGAIIFSNTNLESETAYADDTYKTPLTIDFVSAVTVDYSNPITGSFTNNGIKITFSTSDKILYRRVTGDPYRWFINKGSKDTGLNEAITLTNGDTIGKIELITSKDDSTIIDIKNMGEGWQVPGAGKYGGYAYTYTDGVYYYTYTWTGAAKTVYLSGTCSTPQFNKLIVYPLNKTTVSYTKTAQTYNYGDSDIKFNITGTSLTGFTVQYKVNDTYTTTVPTDAGSYDVKVTRATDSNYIAVDDVITDGLVINKINGSGSVSINGWTFNDTANAPVPVSATNGTNNVTYKYKAKSSADSTYTTTVPTLAGDYTLKATFAATTNYKEVSATCDFTIAKLYLKAIFNNYDGTKLGEGTFEYGATPSYTGTPEKPDTATNSYEFSGWSPALSGITAETTYTAQFTETARKYNIIFKNYDGTELQKTKLEVGATPTYSATPSRAADAQYTYTFSGWDSEIEAVSGDKTYTACYTNTTNKYTITWKNGDTELSSEEVEYGKLPTYTGATPLKDKTATVVYSFSGWTPEVVFVVGDATYTATFDFQEYVVSEEKEYSVSITTDTAKDGIAISKLFENAKDDSGSVSVSVGTTSIVFDNNAVNALGGNDIELKLDVATENLTVDNAELVLEVSLSGVDFSTGSANISIAFSEVAPKGTVAKLFYIDSNGSKTDMKATFDGTNVSFTTNHFSTYAVMFVKTGSVIGTILLILAILIVLAVLYFIVGFYFYKKKQLTGKFFDTIYQFKFVEIVYNAVVSFWNMVKKFFIDLFNKIFKKPEPQQ